MRQREEVQEVSRQGRITAFVRAPITNPGRPIGLALAILSGLLIAAAFPPFDVGWLAWVALAPLVLAIRARPLSQAFGLGFVSGAVAFGIILAWIRIFGVLPWVLLTAYLALFPAAFAAVSRWVIPGRRAWQWVWVAAAAWTALEYLRSVGVTGFPWASLGVTQYRFLPLIQVARYTGVYGVSFLAALVGCACAAVVLVRRPAPILLPAGLLSVVLAWGGPPARTVPAGAITVAAVQPNVSQAQKFDPALAADHMRVLHRLVAAARGQGADLIVFPETAVPQNLFGSEGALGEVGRWAQRAHAPVIASALENGVSNIAVAVTPSGLAVSRYDKVRLVAFGETGIVPGHRFTPLWTPLGQVGVAICFESIFPDVSRALVKNGAQILAVITNDAWLDGTAAPAQHAAHAVLRAVESGRWVVRAANTGISTIIDPVGRVRAILPRQEEGVLAASAAMVNVMTPYVVWGDVFVWAMMMLLVAAVTPQLRPALADQWTRPAFQQTAVAVVLPWAAGSALLRAGAPWGVLPGVLLAFCGLFTVLRWPTGTGWSATIKRSTPMGRFMMTLVGGVVVVVGLWAAMMAAYRLAGVRLAHPDAWAVYLVRQLIMAAAMELWLRGAAFAPLAQWQGSAVAVAVTTVLGMSLQAGLPPEAYAWTLVTGALFGFLRSRTHSAAGLIVPHALGAMLFASIAEVR
ncbi:MAG TPA: apolipoprotein N-acyltransferase [bacterium]|nr:apolipoprotein N-acyltransferase [bacterium]